MKTYLKFLHAIEDFLHSSDAKPFSVDYYCKDSKRMLEKHIEFK